MRLAIVHDYLNQHGGAEQVVAVMREAWPQAPVYTSIYDPQRLPPEFRDWPVVTSFLQRLPFWRRLHKLYLPLYPLAFESFDLRGWDVVLSSSSAWAKGVITGPETCHVSYVNAPMRFAWQSAAYLEGTRIPRLARLALAPILHWLRVWDATSAARVDWLVANSWNVARRIESCWGRSVETVLHPPCDCSRFAIAPEGPEDYFLVVGRLRPYKAIDRAVAACTRARLPLVVVGTGSDRARLERLAGPTVTFTGPIPQAELARRMSRCRALVFPGEEDLGIAPLEAMASGRPVIALGRGGALETVVPDNGWPPEVANREELARRAGAPTGRFVVEPTVEALEATLAGFDPLAYDPAALRRHALAFDRPRFRERLVALVQDLARRHRARQTLPADGLPGLEGEPAPRAPRVALERSA